MSARTDTERIVNIEIQTARAEERDNYQTRLLEEIKTTVIEMRRDQKVHEKQDDVKFQDVYERIGHAEGGIAGAKREIGWIKKIYGGVISILGLAASWWALFKK